MATLVLLSMILGVINSLNLPSNEGNVMNITKTLLEKNVGEQRGLGGSAGFGIYIGGGVGGLVGLILLLVLIYFFCFRRR